MRHREVKQFSQGHIAHRRAGIEPMQRTPDVLLTTHSDADNNNSCQLQALILSYTLGYVLYSVLSFHLQNSPTEQALTLSLLSDKNLRLT